MASYTLWTVESSYASEDALAGTWIGMSAGIQVEMRGRLFYKFLSYRMTSRSRLQRIVVLPSDIVP